MYQKLKDFFFLLFRLSGQYRRERARQRGGIVILTYHSVVARIPENNHRFEYRNCVTEAQFEEQIRFMLDKYHPVTIQDVVDGNYRADWCGFLISFDDGFRNNLKRAVPILEKYGLQGCFCVSTGLVGREEMIWPERITYLLMGSSAKEIELDLDTPQVFSLLSAQDREQASWKIRRYLKAATKEKIDQVLAQLENRITDIIELSPEEMEERYAFMTWKEVAEMSRRGQAIASHTHNHEVLSTLHEEQSQKELHQSRELLTKHSASDCVYFSYPNGAVGDFNELHKQQLRDEGYLCAMSQIEGTNFPGGDLYELRRVNISAMMTPLVFEAAVCGMLAKVKGGN